MISGGILALIGTVIFFGGALMAFDDIKEEGSERLIYSSTSGSVELSPDYTYSVYVLKGVSCNNVDLSIDDGVYDYFIKNCHQVEPKTNLVYIGSADTSYNGEFYVESSTEIRIYEVEKDSETISPVFFVTIFAGEGLCCLSFISLIIGVVLLIVDRKNNQKFVIIPNQQMVLQPIQNEHN